MEEDLDQFVRTTSLIYESSILPNNWPTALKSLCTIFRAKKAHIIYINKIDYHVSFSCGYGLNPAQLNISAKKFKRCLLTDPIAIYGVTHINEVFSDRRVICPEALSASEMQKKIRSPNNIEFMLTVVMEDETEEWTIISIDRPKDSTAFNEADEKTLQIYAPHLRQAGQTHKKLRYSGNAHSVQATVLNSLELPLFVLDEKHQVLVCNKVAQRFIKGSNFLSIKDNYLFCRQARDNIQLQHIIDIAINDKKHTRIPARLNYNGKSFLVTARRLPAQQLHESNTQISTNANFYIANFPTHSFVTLAFREPNLFWELDTGILTLLFGLTSAEASLAICLTQDKTISEAAKILGRSIGTARVQLQSIFEKTRTKRQSSLVNLILSIP